MHVPQATPIPRQRRAAARISWRSCRSQNELFFNQKSNHLKIRNFYERKNAPAYMHFSVNI